MKRPIPIAVMLVLCATPVLAQVPERIHWQSYLTDTGGQPVVGPVNLIISLYDAPTGGNMEYQKDTTNVMAEYGVVSVPLGPFPDISFDKPLFLGLRVNGGEEGAPRAPLGSVPYAHRAIAVTGFRGEEAAEAGYEGVNVIAGAPNNTIAAGVVGGTIGGGGGVGDATPLPNLVTAHYATIGGGLYNDATGFQATIGGGRSNTASGPNSTVAGGYRNAAQGSHGAVGGGTENVAVGSLSTVGGGESNDATGAHSAVGGGWGNAAGGGLASVGGGLGNAAGGNSAVVAGGRANTAGGDFAAVPGGWSNAASGHYSFAAGWGAKALHKGTFVWADGSGPNFESTAENQFAIRANGGVLLAGTAPNDDGRIFSDPFQSGSDLWLHANDAVVAQIDRNHNGSGNFYVQNGTPEFVFRVTHTGQVIVNGTTVHGSDRNKKDGIEPVDPAAVLEGVLSLPISRWRYIGDDATRMGPMAQDFAAAFGLGTDETSIAAVDADGVALAAIQGLHEMVLELRAENAELRTRLEALEP